MWEGMGSVPLPDGVGFRVWAPNAEAVFVSGDFNGRSETKNKLSHEGGGYWAAKVPEARPGHSYEYVIHYQTEILKRNDPYGRDVENSIGRSIIVDPALFDWGGDGAFQMPSFNKLVIYAIPHQELT